MNPLNIAHKIMDWFCPLSEPEQQVDIDPKVEITAVETTKTTQEWPNIHFGD